MAYNIQFKRATAARIAEVPNTVLFAGEPLLDTTNNQLYIGDGATKLSNLKPIQNTQSVLDDMVTKGLLTSTTTTIITGTEDYTTDIIQLDSSNSPQGTIEPINTTMAIISISENAYDTNTFKVNFEYPVTTGVLGSGDLDSMINVATANSYWGSISIVWLNNGVETTFYKDINDMSQTLTREGPFQYQTNSDNNMFIFIDPQTTLKSFSVINNHWCNPDMLIRLTNATYESTESVTTYALNLPTATSGTLGMVKPDNSTITVDANGVVTANIPTPTTVDQTYDATSTNAQSGAAIASAGFMNGSIVQSPLEYLPDTTSSITLHNINSTTLTDTRNNGYYTVDIVSGAYCHQLFLRDSVNNTYINLMENPTAINLDNLSYAEIQLRNGINIEYSISSNNIVGVLGYYDNGIFVPKFVREAINASNNALAKVENTAGNFWQNNTLGIIYGMYKEQNNTNLVLNGMNNTGTSGTINSFTLSQQESDDLDACTHCRLIAVQGGPNAAGNSTINLNNIRFINPATSVTSGTTSVQYNTFINSNNLFDVHPESLSLKYDSNTLGVNANNELYALSSTPSNMVTTDTSQTIAVRKDFTNTQVFSGAQYYSNVDGIQLGANMTIYRSSNSNSANISLMSNESNNIYLKDKSNSTIGGIVTKNNKFRLITDGIGTKIYRETSTPISNPTNFLLEKDMLDGTTVTYNSSTGKIEVPVDGTYIIYDSNTGKVTLDLTALKTALDAL